MKRLHQHIMAWIDDRTGIRTIIQELLAGTVSKHGAWLRTTGVAILALVFLECVTGPILALYYSPNPTTAYSDILAIQANPFGRFIRGMHHFASAAIILLSLATIIRIFLMAEYRKRRDLVWLSTLIFFQFALFFQLTGHLLTWDTNAVATADVEAGFANNAWVVGPVIKKFILGGTRTGAATLTRWYGIHVALLPVIAVVLVALPLFWARRNKARSSHEAADTGAGISEPYYPNHLAREMIVALVAVLAVAGLALTRGAPLELAATAQNLTDYKAFAEWYVLPLHALTLIAPFDQVTFEPIATLVAPGILIGILFLLPFLDKNPSTSLRKRPFAVFGFISVMLIGGGLYGWVVKKEGPEIKTQEEKIAIMKGEKTPAIDAALLAKGKELYSKNGCDGCHAIGGKGGKAGPDLTRAGLAHSDRAWQIEHLIKPTSKVPGSTMPGYETLKPDDLKALGEYMVSLVK